MAQSKRFSIIAVGPLFAVNVCLKAHLHGALPERCVTLLISTLRPGSSLVQPRATLRGSLDLPQEPLLLGETQVYPLPYVEFFDWMHELLYLGLSLHTP